MTAVANREAVWLPQDLDDGPGGMLSDVSRVQRNLPASFFTLDDCRIALDLKLASGT